MKVIYLGATQEQIDWGSNDDPREILKVGSVYEVEVEDVRSWHTKIKLKGIEGMFNSAHFDEIEPEAAL